MDNPIASSPLIEIPYVDATEGGALAVARAEAGRFQAIVRAGRERYGSLAIGIGDVVSRTWLRRQNSRLADEIDAVSDEAGRGGAWLLNLSYEWCCTTGAGPDPSGRGNRMLRTLDWPMQGLGETIVVARFKGKAGPYFNVTWPGFAGVVTAMAPGRFSAAINQPPFRKWSRSCWLDWGINRGRLLASKAPPPTHLLREIFDTCATYDEARERLLQAPLAIPAFITLSGTSPDQACLIEREENAASVHASPTACANHWMQRNVPGHNRGHDSLGRRALMTETRDQADDGFAWVTPPILNETTRVAVVANALEGKLMVRGYERQGVVTQDFQRPVRS
ncbi:MAG: hypothetical protein WD075_00920 [Rhodospirillales bacterium]